ncbi:MAG TPA: MFS transporter [Phycisphaerae bacterium]|nr:MFS transporter [Phycisphaerae bacterium]
MTRTHPGPISPHPNINGNPDECEGMMGGGESRAEGDYATQEGGEIDDGGNRALDSCYSGGDMAESSIEQAPGISAPAAPAPVEFSPRVLRRHLAAIACLGCVYATSGILPFLARQRFGAANWQTTVLTAAVPVTQFFAIFWNHLYARIPTRTYLIIIGLLACGPLALIGTARTIWEVMFYFVLAALGGAGGVASLSPISADLLRTCYYPGRHGRIFAVLCVVQFTATMVAGQIMGSWSDRNPDAFRIYFPILALLMLGGLVFFGLISRDAAWQNRIRYTPASGGSWWTPLKDMRTILKADRRFAGYEAAFMSYGIGWMICTALVPALATDQLHLNYSQFAQATIVVYQLVNILLFLPLGRVSDRFGPMRLASASFLWLTIYPIGLMFTGSALELGACVTFYAVGMVGVQLTWTLGPLQLSGDSAKAPHYLAIHSTMVGFRGIVAQGLGMALYSMTDSFAIPLAMAAAGFAWGSWRMRALSQGRP